MSVWQVNWTFGTNYADNLWIQKVSISCITFYLIIISLILIFFIISIWTVTMCCVQCGDVHSVPGLFLVTCFSLCSLVDWIYSSRRVVSLVAFGETVRTDLTFGAWVGSSLPTARVLNCCWWLIANPASIEFTKAARSNCRWCCCGQVPPPLSLHALPFWVT